MNSAVVIIFWFVLSMVVATWIGWKAKGRPLLGLALGFFLGWIGMVIIALVPPTAEKKVQNRMREDAIEAEVAARKMGHRPWSYPEVASPQTPIPMPQHQAPPPLGDETQQWPAQSYPPPYPPPEKGPRESFI